MSKMGSVPRGVEWADVTEAAGDAYWLTRGPVDSRTVGRISEVTHVTDMRRGSVGVGLPLSYAARLKLVLGTLGGTRGFRSRSHRYFKSPLSRLRTLHYFRWVLIDRETRLLFASEFDNSWEKYIRQFVESVPNLVDLIWTHTEGYEWGTCSDYVRFSHWVQAHQQEAAAFFVANPSSTVKDIQQLERLKQHLDRFLGDVSGVEPADPVRALSELRAKIERLHEQRYRIGDELRDEFFPPPHAWHAERAREYEQIEAAFGSLAPYFTPSERGMFDAALREFMGSEWLDYKATTKKRSATAPAAVPVPSREPAGVSLSEIQANVLDPFSELHHAEVLFFRVDAPEAGARFLAELAPRVTTGATAPEHDAINVALSFTGLRALGFGSVALQSFPDEFRIGMAGRAAQLGDGDVSLPDFWTPPLAEGGGGERISLEAVDVVVFVQAASPPRLAAVVERVLSDAVGAGIGLLGRENGSRELDANGGEIEPFFRYRDGISQPRIPELGHAVDGEQSIALGEVVLLGERLGGAASRVPELDRLGLGEVYENGSFLALRRFERLPQTSPEPTQHELSLRFGRERDGAPLLESRGSNGFDYGRDLAGKACPFAAHARRANPRFTPPHPEGRVPRITRRALSTRSAGGEAGLLFMAFNANLAQQYEVLQLWLNNANVAGGFSTDADPIAGSSGEVSSFVHFDAGAGRHRTTLVVPQLRVAWGLYLFEPARAVLANLTRLAASSRLAGPKSWPLRNAHGKAADGKDAQTLERCLSESPTKATASESVWNEVRACGGVARSAYGVLVENLELVLDVFARDGRDFSVMEYGRRLENAVGRALFLGEDYGDQRPEPLRLANAVFQARDTILFVRERTRQIMQAILEQARSEPRPRAEPPGVKLMQILPEVLPVVVSEIYGFGWSAAEAAKALGIAVDLASFVFNPHVAALGCPALRGPATTESGLRIEQVEKTYGNTIKALCARRSAAALPITTVAAALGESASPDALTSLVLGTLAPTAGTYSSLVKQWVGESEMGRVRSRVLGGNDGAWAVDRALLRQELLSAMQRTPMPSILYRRVLRDTTLAGVALDAGEFLLLRISSTRQEHRPGALGLIYGHGVHQCPGIEVSLALLGEVFATLFEQPNARPRPGKGEIAFDA